MHALLYHVYDISLPRRQDAVAVPASRILHVRGASHMRVVASGTAFLLLAALKPSSALAAI